MTYLIEDRTYKTPETYVDRGALARDLAPAINGVADVENGASRYATVRIEVQGFTIVLMAEHGAKANRVRISAHAPHAMTRKLLTYTLPKPFPAITVDASRPLAAIVKEVQRRILPEALEAMAALKVKSDEMIAAREQAEKSAAALRQRVAGLQVTFKDDDTTQADIYANGNGVYLSGRMASDGTIYPDRVGSIPADRAADVLALLCGKA